MNQVRTVSLLLAILFWAQAATATSFRLQPLRTRDLSPVAIGTGLPALRPAQTLAAGSSRAALTIDLVSNNTIHATPDENLLFDGESYRLELAIDYGLGPKLEVGFALPLFSHRGGFLDGFIEGWHDTFGLPQGGRDQAPHGRLDYRYERSDGNGFRLAAPATGLGDLRLLAGWQCLRDDTAGRSLALRASLKLPTGDSDRLLGGGGWDLALWLSGEQRWTTGGTQWLLYGGTGILVGNDNEPSAALRRNLLGTLNLGLGWQPFSRLGLQLQFDGHTSLIRATNLDELAGFAGQLAIGGSLALNAATTLELAVVEDILVGTTPDVVLHLSLRRRF